MVKEIIKELAGFYNRRIEFNTVEKENETVASFKIGEELIADVKYVTMVRINVYEDHITVLNVRVMPIPHTLF